MQKFIYLIILLFTILASCNKQKSNTSKKTDITDFSSIELTVERGAFHYDSFILKDTTITFFPEKEMDSVEHIKYYTNSKQSISKSVRDNFIQKIIDDGIWNLNKNYKPSGTCTSMVTVTISLQGKTKKIVCDDYIRSCPDVIKFIENEIVRLHNKNLKRIFLPG